MQSQVSEVIPAIREEEQAKFLGALTKFLEICSTAATPFELMDGHGNFLDVIAAMNHHTALSALTGIIEDVRQSGFSAGYAKRHNEGHPKEVF